MRIAARWKLQAEDYKEYAAFISYSHETDSNTGLYLHNAIERFPGAWYHARSRRVFLDSQSLGPSSSLWDRSIVPALQASKFLILLASPESAKSSWVVKEIEWWLANKTVDTIIVAYLRGNVIRADPTGRLISGGAGDALPDILLDALTQQPLWATLPELPTKRFPVNDANLSDSWKGVVGSIVSTIEGTSKDFLIGKHIRNQNRWRRIRRISTVVLCLLFVIAVGATGFGFQQHVLSEDRLRTAAARGLVAQADAKLQSDPRLAISLNEAAYSVSPSQETASAIVRNLSGSRFFGSLPGRPQSAIGAEAAAPNGELFASAGGDEGVTVWSVEDWSSPHKLSTDFRSAGLGVTTLAFSPDSTILALGSRDGTLSLWDTTNSESIQLRSAPLTGFKDGVENLAFSADGHQLSIASNGNIYMLDPTGGPTSGKVRSFPVELMYGNDCLRFSPDGRELVACRRDRQAVVLSVETGIVEGVFEDTLVSFAPIPNTKLALTHNYQGQARLWDISDLAHPLPLALFAESVSEVAVSPDGQTMITAGFAGMGSFWDLSALPNRLARLPLPISGHRGPIGALTFSADGRYVVSGGHDGQSLIWRSAPLSAKPVGVPLKGPPGRVSSTVFTPTGGALIVAGLTSFTVWDVGRNSPPAALSGPYEAAATGITAMAISPDGRSLAITGDHALGLWDISNPSAPVRRSFSVVAPGDKTLSVAFSPDGNLIAFGNGDSRVELWNVSDISHPHRSDSFNLAGGHGSSWDHGASTVSFSHTGKVLAVGSFDGSTYLYRVSDNGISDPAAVLEGHLNGVANGVTTVAFSPSHDLLAAGGADGSVIFWDTVDVDNPARLGDRTEVVHDSVRTLTFSPSGDFIATNGDNNVLSLWDVSDPGRPFPIGPGLAGNENGASSVGFSRTGLSIAVGDYMGTTRLWNMDEVQGLKDDPVRHACAVTGTGLDVAAWKQFLGDLPYVESC